MPDDFKIFDVSSPLTVEKRPLHREMSPAPDFPVEALGPLRDAAEAIQMMTQASIAICCQAVLAAVSVPAQFLRSVELPGGGRKPLTGIFFSVAESGERKSSVDKLALAAITAMERRWMEQHPAELAHYFNELDAWKAAREHIKKMRKGDRAAMREAFDDLGPEPKRPLSPMILLENFTPEGLERQLAEGRPWCGVFSAEGGVVLGGHAFSNEAEMRTVALFNKIWDGDPIRRVRAQNGATFLMGRRCTCHIMMQPGVADKLFNNAMFASLGFTARGLLVAPESTAGKRCWRETPTECRTVLETYNLRLEYLLSCPPTFASGTIDVLDPPPLTLNSEARTLWTDFFNWTEGMIRQNGEWHVIKAFGAKAAEHAGRLAAVLTVYDNPDAVAVSAKFMAYGISLARHYGAELLRLQDAAAISPDLRLAGKLLSWWQERPIPQLHLACIYQSGPNAIRDAATARRLVGILEDHGWVRRLAERTVMDGKERREAWELVL